MIFRLLVFSAFFLILNSSYGQNYNDTLYFKSGMIRAADIEEHHYKTIRYYYVNSKEEKKYTSVNVGKLKYFVVYDSLNTLEFDSRKEK